MDNDIIAKIMDGLVERYKETKYPISGKSYIHWRDHAPRTETKARGLAAIEAGEILQAEIRDTLTYEDLIRLGIEALHRLGRPPKCYDDQGDVYLLYSDGHRKYTGQIYLRWVKN